MRLHAYISGKVHGVGYRYNTRKVAIRLHLNGWVKNLPDGRVEIIAEGPRRNLEKFLEWLHQGPRMAKVNRVQSKLTKESAEYRTFRIQN
jgi:acylphosphatase